jgi:hypothetical protein
MKLGLTNIPQVSTNSFSALPCVRGERADAGRSAHGLSVDWQAWGTQSGPCWRAPRDGVRHVPAGPPKSSVPKNPVTPLSRDTHKQRFPARRAKDKGELSRLGLWPPSAGPVSLPALAMPPLEELLSEQIVLMPGAPSESPVFAECRDSSASPERIA